MPDISSIASTSTQSAAASQANSGGFNDLGSGDFLKILLSELQNQDPLNPTDNSEFIQQISQIRTIGSTDSLTTSLTTLRQSQELVTASSMIGKQVQGLADDATQVDGKVTSVTVEANQQNNTRKVKVHVGGQTMDITNIRTIQTGA